MGYKLYRPKKVKGVPLEDCTKFVWSLVHKLPHITQFSKTIDKDDLFQVGFMELIKQAEKLKIKNWLKHPYTCYVVRWRMIKELLHYSRLVTVRKEIYENLQALNKQFKHTEYWNPETGSLDFDRIKVDFSGKFKSRDIDICSRLTRYAYADFKLVDNLQNSDKDNTYIEESLMETVLNLNIQSFKKDIFLSKFGIGCPKISTKNLTKVFGLSEKYIYQCITDVRDLLLQTGWVTDEYGASVAKRIRIRRFS